MHISAVLAFVCLAVGVAPSFSLPSSSNREDTPWGHNDRAKLQRYSLFRNNLIGSTRAGNDQSMPTNVAPLPSSSDRPDPNGHGIQFDHRGSFSRHDLDHNERLNSPSQHHYPGENPHTQAGKDDRRLSTQSMQINGINGHLPRTNGAPRNPRARG
ncbi:hypothetical protein F5148DRAFT_728925 [Russula earlei]|uniref:Uncharacterized protein n=1 Tax=Russula earlei TaxID=71964 RepID=A0ACC0UMB6_9AGAM|nr:hypothetical protein F5148DRAFT_728925 [Russula earlei]